MKQDSSKRGTWVLGVVVIAMLSLAGCSRQTAEEKGKELATEKIDLVKGIGTAVEEKGAAAAESVTGGLGQVVKGAGKGIEKSGRAVVTGAGLTTAGLKVTKVQNASVSGNEPVHGLEAYVIADKPAKGHLRVTVYNLLDQEIGRAKVALTQAADEASYQTIPLDSRIQLTDIAKVSFDFQPEDAPASK